MHKKDAHEIEDSELIGVKGVKQSVNKKLKIFDWEKCVFDSISAPITKQ